MQSHSEKWGVVSFLWFVWVLVLLLLLLFVFVSFFLGLFFVLFYSVVLFFWFFTFRNVYLTLFRIDFLGAARRWGGQKDPLSKICHTYPTMMKLGAVIPYLKKIQKMYKSRNKPCDFCWHKHFFGDNQKILIYQEIKM